MSFKILFSAFLIFSSTYIYAQQIPALNDLFSNDEINILTKGEIITKAHLKNKKTIHTPNTSEKINIPNTAIINKDISDYEMICVEKAFIQYNLSDKSKLKLYNILNSPSALRGMKYYSVTDKKAQDYIIESVKVDPVEDNEIKDIKLTKIDSQKLYYFKIKDNRLGALTFKCNILNRGDNFIQQNICTHPIRKYLIKINDKEEYQLTSFYIYSEEYKGYFIYTLNAIRIRSKTFLNLGLITPESFANRVRAGTVYFAGLLGIDMQKMLRAF